MSKMKSIREIEMERALEPNFGKGITVASGFDLGAKAPLDSRLTVKTIEERDAHVAGNRAYEGMLVFVEADKKTYQLINNVWEEFGFNEEKFQAGVKDIVDKNEEQDERLNTLEQLVVGGEGEGLSAVIADVAKNKADIANLQGGLADEVAAREEAVRVINEEVAKKANQSDLQLEVERAEQAEQALGARIDTVDGKVVDNASAIEVNTGAIAKEVSDRKAEIARVEGVVAEEVARAKAAEQGLQSNIDTKVSTEAFEAEKVRVNGALGEKATKVEFEAEKERVDGLFGQVNTTLEGHGTLIDTVTKLAQANKEDKADKTQVATDIEAGVVEAKGYADDKAVEVKGYADGKLVEAKAYTDEEIVKVGATISGVEAAYKAADIKVLADAKAHADKAVADLVDNAPEALNTLKELAEALTQHEGAYESLLEVVGTKANASDVHTKSEVEVIKTGLETSIGNIDKAYKAADVALDARLKTVEGIAGGVGAIQSDVAKAKEDILANAAVIAENKGLINANAQAITKEVQDRTQAVAGLDSKIVAEKDRALAAESNLDGKIATANQKIVDAEGNIAKNATAITQEAANRTQAINVLEAKVNNMNPVTGGTQPVDRAEGHIWIEIL